MQRTMDARALKRGERVAWMPHKSREEHRTEKVGYVVCQVPADNDAVRAAKAAGEPLLEPAGAAGKRLHLSHGGERPDRAKVMIRLNGQRRSMHDRVMVRVETHESDRLVRVDYYLPNAEMIARTGRLLPEASAA